MKKTKLPVILALALMLVLLFAFPASAESEQPIVTVSDVSIRVDSGNEIGLRFTSRVELPLPDGAVITEQGTLIIPLYVNGENDFTLDTEKVLKVKKTEDAFYSCQKTYYEYTAVLEKIPQYHLNTPLCARSYITYTLGGETYTVYSEIVIHDIYSLALQVKNTDPIYATVQEKIVSLFSAYDTAVKSESVDAEGLAITAPAENTTVYPYVDDAKTYLASGITGDASYLGNYSKYNDAAKAIDITWTDTGADVKSYTVMYATQDDYSDARYAWSTADSCKVSLYNLFKSSDYYVKVIANLEDGTTRTVTTTFKTTDLGPRVIHLDGSYNARDLGGYVSSLGGTTKQGLIYRSGQFDKYGSYDSTITAYGKYAAQKDLGLATELDFRTGQESALPGTTYKVVTVGGYTLADTTNQKYIKQVFEILANPANYPILFHCQGGADRTGTIAYLFNALLGLSDLDLAHDYEFTSYSVYGLRHMSSTSYIAKTDYAFFTTLNAQEGDTLQKRVENYLVNVCGVTADQIASIKSIMLDQAS